ncbi:potassium channel SKOR isoform X1 [Daucus carota subsp. sativus]|uniref:potassium channel SKOR isoform X1 n=1 Tax=Daucus carota subsp. sativus TaxID=79200 RepID=UPI003083289D
MDINREEIEDACDEKEEGSPSNKLLSVSLCWEKTLAFVSTAHAHPRGLFIHPQSWGYVLWTQFILIWAVYSSFFTPLEFGFFRGLPENLFLLDIAGQLAFLIDIVIHFFVAYWDSHSHSLVFNHNRIAIRYLKSRFLIDFLGCLPWDVIYQASGRKEPVRYLLWIRLSRAVRVTELFEKLEKDIRVNYLFTRIIKLFVVELYCTHTAACIFYYLATTLPPAQEGYTWIGSLKMGDYNYSHFRDIDLWTRYITSLYFAIVTMATVGYGDVHAVNNREMIFIMIFVSLDMILGAYLLGNMAALIVKGSKTEKFRDKMSDLLEYMNRKKLGKQIFNEIKGHVQSQYANSCTEAAVLQDIPISFRARISERLYVPYIREVPIFKGCSSGFVKQIASKVHEETFLPGEVIAEQGDFMDQLYIVCHGKLGGTEGEFEEPVHFLQSHSSLGEMSVLCNIRLPYTVQVLENSKLLRLDKQSFLNLLDVYFSDGRFIINNLLEGKTTILQNKILESDIVLHIGQHESELAMKLNCAAFYGDLPRLKRLVAAGADTSNTDYDGRSPLHLAASKGNEDIVKFLLQKEARVSITDNYGNTPLHEAIKHSHESVASLLVKSGASLDIIDAGNCLCMAVVREDFDYLRKVMEIGANPNSKNYDLRTPLHLASSKGLYAIAHVLLDAGASVFAKDRWGNTPLDEARIGGNKTLIQLLENAKHDQLLKFPNCLKGFQDVQRKCTVFPFHSWDHQERRLGVVLWIPQNIEELIEAAKKQLKLPGSCYIITEDGGKILDLGMICDGQKLFLVSDNSET